MSLALPKLYQKYLEKERLHSYLPKTRILIYRKSAFLIAKNSHCYLPFTVKLDNATISNAKFALNLWNPLVTTSTGGIVIADDSHFLNNTQSVHALNYRNFHPVTGAEMDYQAIFTNCDFQLDEKYKGTYEFFKHVDLSFLRGVKFRGCDFTLSKDAVNVNWYNHGIAAYSAGFSVGPICRSQIEPCTDYDKSSFSGLRSGISVRNYNSTNTFTVTETIFENLVYGIDNYSANNATIVKNFLW